MVDSKSWVRIDVSQRNLDVHIRPSGDICQHPNDEDGIHALVTFLESVSIERIVIEATGPKGSEAATKCHATAGKHTQ